jgi:recombination protein RecA
MDAKCIECGTIFEAKRSTAKFCSSNCRVKYNKKMEPDLSEENGVNTPNEPLWPSPNPSAEALRQEKEAIETPVMAVKKDGKVALMPSPEKLAKLRETMAKINKDFGEGSIMCLGDKPQGKVEVISTGSLSLNRALGVGGLPKGRIVELYGPESSGKTTLALHVIAEAQKQGGLCAFIDVEHAFDEVYAKAVGINIDQLHFSQPDYGEQALEEADRLITSGSVAVVVIDSVAALAPKAELEGEMGDTKMGLIARLMSQACRKLTASVSKTNTLCIFINQLRANIGNMYVPEVTSGGNALKYYSSVRLEVRKAANSRLMDGEEQFGVKTKVKVVKNKVAPPFKIAEFDIIFGEGIDYIGELIDEAVLKRVIEKSGSWYAYNGTKIGQGKEVVRGFIQDNEEILAEIKSKLEI